MADTAAAPSKDAPSKSGAASPPALHVAPSPHLSDQGVTTRRMMVDVLLALTPVTVVAVAVFGVHALQQLVVCVACCLAVEAGLTALRGRKLPLLDGSAAVTGVILALSLPWSAPLYVAVIASCAAIALGKFIFGGLGQNLFNPAMVGRAFVMISFASALGAGAFEAATGTGILTQATPLTAARAGSATPLLQLLIGNVNGSLGETSALACLLGGGYLCWRRSASWEIPLGVILGCVALAGIGNLLDPSADWTVLHHLLGGALLFGAFFIATDPVSSPLTPKGKLIFGLGTGALVYVIRVFSGYPEGVMFAVLLMNSVTPLINRFTIPRPLGGPVPKRA